MQGLANGREAEPSSGFKEPGVSNALNQIQHIIKDSTSGQQGSGYVSSRDPVSVPPEAASSRQQGYATGLQEPQASSLEDDMSEISISEPAAQTSNASDARKSELKPKLSGPRKSLQPPTSPFAAHDEPFATQAPAGTTQRATFDVEVRNTARLLAIEFP